MFAFVVTFFRETRQPVKAGLDEMGIPSQFVLANNIMRTKGMSTFSMLLKQINAKCGLDLYRIQMPSTCARTMMVGVDVINIGRQAIVGMNATLGPNFTQRFSAIEYQQLNI